MRLTLIINNTEHLDGGAKATAVFDESGGVIGAATDAAWVLADRSGAIAPQHAEILYFDSGFCLEVIADDGVQVNGAAQPLGPGEQFRLTDGDTVKIGKFNMTAFVTMSLDEDFARTQGEKWAQRFVSVGSLVGDEAEDGFSGSNLFESKIMRRDGNIALRERLARAQQTDPVQMLDESNRGRATVLKDPVAAFERSRDVGSDAMASRLSEYLNLEPEAASTAKVPDDLQPGSAYLVPPRPRAINKNGEKSVASEATPADDIDTYLEMLASSSPDASKGPRLSTQEIAVRDHWTGNAQADPSDENLVDHVVARPLCQALGLPIQTMTVPQANQLAREVGEALKTAIAGIMDAHKRDLSSRGNLAETHLHAIEDNPLRLDQSPEDVVRELFLAQSPVHLSASAAISESLSLLRFHQEASEAASEAALDAVLQALAPLALAKRFAKYKGHAPRTGDLDAWHWNMYQHYYAEMRSSHQGGLSRMFREVFGQVYDREMRQRSREA